MACILQASIGIGITPVAILSIHGPQTPLSYRYPGLQWSGFILLCLEITYRRTIASLATVLGDGPLFSLKVINIFLNIKAPLLNISSFSAFSADITPYERLF